MNTTLNQAVNLIATLQPFKGNSLYARNTTNYYIVYSYRDNYPIAAWDYDEKLWYVNAEKYSVTTSRHQSIVKQALGNAERTVCNTTELLSLLNKG